MGILSFIPKAIGLMSGSHDVKKLGKKQRDWVRSGRNIVHTGIKRDYDKTEKAIPKVTDINKRTVQGVFDAQSKASSEAKDALTKAIEGGASSLTQGEKQALNSALSGMKGAYEANQGGIRDYAANIGSGLDASRGQMLSGYEEQLGTLDRMGLESNRLGQKGIGTYQESMSDIERSLNPYMQGGEQAQRALLAGSGLGKDAGYEQFYKSPDYNFRMQEGKNAIERSAAAKGGLFSGATGKSLNDYAQNVASGSFNDYMNRLSGIANTGQQASTSYSGFNQNNAQGISGIYGDMAGRGERLGNSRLGVLGNRSADMQENTLASSQNLANRDLGLSGLSAKYNTDINKALATNAQKTAAINAEMQAKLGGANSNYSTQMGNLNAGRTTGLNNLDAQQIQNQLANYLNFNAQQIQNDYAQNEQLGAISSEVYKGASAADRAFYAKIAKMAGKGIGGFFGGPMGAKMGAEAAGTIGQPYAGGGQAGQAPSGPSGGTQNPYSSIMSLFGNGNNQATNAPINIIPQGGGIYGGGGSQSYIPQSNPNPSYFQGIY